MRYAEVYLHRQMVPVGGLAGHTAVVFDVLRASTTAAQALHAGADCVVPFADIEEMRRFQEGLPEDVLVRSVLAGERGGLAAPGFDLGNSPEEFRAEAVEGKVVIFSTTNGTDALSRAAEADPVYFGSLVNLSPLADLFNARARRENEELALVCAGTELCCSVEDMLAAGMLLEKLGAREAGWELDDGALAVLAVAAEWKGREAECMRKAVGGRHVAELGLDADIEFAARVDSIPVVPRLVTEWSGLPGADVLIKAGG
jgi:2-phosphosulfolactate phosphatase